MPTPSITCPLCGTTATTPNDIAHGYCGRCCSFTRDCAVGRCPNTPTVQHGGVAFCAPHNDELNPKEDDGCRD